MHGTKVSNEDVIRGYGLSVPELVRHVFQINLKQLLEDAGIDEKYRVRAFGGDLFTEKNPFVNRLREEPGWELFEPYEPYYGCPVYGDSPLLAS